MAEYIHLVGAEQIQSAANRMVEAAHEINRAANTIHDAMQRHEEVMRDLMIKIDNVVDELEKRRMKENE
jgi:glycine cleavage system pyridoxal-binding protein P